MQTRRSGPRNAKKTARGAQPVFIPQLPDVLQAMRTLYLEELRPYGRILRKRIGEIAFSCFGQFPDVDAKVLRQICESCDFISVEEQDGCDWSAVFTGIDARFVDCYSAEDPYPAELWEQMAKYLETLDGENIALPGMRYSCAQVLAGRELPFLSGRSLGQLCHIVQLAISHRKVLGYLNGTLVPYALSQSAVKEQAAVCQRPCSIGAVNDQGMPYATIELARGGLRELLESVPGPRPSCMPLSNVKRLFRSRFYLDLSETALGYAKLCDLLQDSRFGDICSVRMDCSGYIVMQAEERRKSAEERSDATGETLEGSCQSDTASDCQEEEVVILAH